MKKNDSDAYVGEKMCFLVIFTKGIKKKKENSPRYITNFNPQKTPQCLIILL